MRFAKAWSSLKMSPLIMWFLHLFLFNLLSWNGWSHGVKRHWEGKYWSSSFLRTSALTLILSFFQALGCRCKFLSSSSFHCLASASGWCRNSSLLIFLPLFSYHELNMTSNNPAGLMYLFQIVFALYMLVTTIVLINLLIAMMSDTYQRIQVFPFSSKWEKYFLLPGSIRCWVEVWAVKAD